MPESGIFSSMAAAFALDMAGLQYLVNWNSVTTIRQTIAWLANASWTPAATLARNETNIMLFKEYQPDDMYKVIYKWRLTSAEMGEFEVCGNCEAEAPLADFMSEKNPLCQICSSVVAPSRETIKDSVAVLNVALTIAGHFDEFEVDDVTHEYQEYAVLEVVEVD